ncbi:uncharacterized protein [Atheta coriaria]|uniref:uncharacterized protein n=1 Tax=Dalotia coriaria TaxID=877792 RepID=UPI0031F434A3
MDDEEHHSTEWALLFPLKTGLFAMKSSHVARSAERIKHKKAAKEPAVAECQRLRMRRGSSMSELDKLAAVPLPYLVRSTTANNQLSASPSSLPHSPYLSRSINSNAYLTRGSIGDLMNQKKYGSSQWSVRSETLIAKTVPLSTVTPRHSPPGHTRLTPEEEEVEEDSLAGPLTVAQRTQRLAKLLKQQRAAIIRKNMAVCDIFTLKFFRADIDDLCG